MDLVRYTRSVAMATATTTTTTVAAAGMVETVADTRTLTIIAQLVAAVIPSSKATTPVYRSAKLTRGKAMATVTTATINVVATGTVATVAQKQTRSCHRNLFCTVMNALAWMKRKPNAASRARCSLGLRTKSAMTKITTADVIGTEETVAASRMIIGTVTVAHVWTRRLSMLMLSARKTAPCISGRAMENATTQIMSAVATGTVETAVDTPAALISTSTVTARSVSAAIPLLWPRNAMGNARCSSGVAMAIATTITTTAAVIGMAETVAEKKQHTFTVENAVAKIRISRALYAANHVWTPLGKETRRAMTKIITAVVVGMVGTAAVPPKITTTFTAPNASVWTRKISLN